MKDNLFWELVQSYFETNKYFITKHHLDSYNDFVDHMIPRVIKTLNPFSIVKYDQDGVTEKHRIEIYIGRKDGKGIYFDHPTITNDGKTRLMFPNDARLHDLTYATNLHCDVEIEHYNRKQKGETTMLEKVKIGRIPIMLHSKLCILSGKKMPILKEFGECMYDQGGYFIIDGKEKVIVTQERNVTNQIFIHHADDKKFAYNAFIRCMSEKDSVFPKKVDFNVFSKNFMKGIRKNAIVVRVPHLDFDIPLFILFRCLGFESDLDIIKCIIGNNIDSDEGRLFLDFLYPSITDANIIYTQKQAISYLKPFTEYKTEKYVEYILRYNLFPNIEYDYHKFDPDSIDKKDSDDNDYIMNTSKAMFLGHVVNKLVKVCLGMDSTTDRDNYMFRRVAISGFLVGDIFKDFYNLFRVKARSTLDKIYRAGDWNSREMINRSVTESNKADIFDPLIITGGLTKSLKGTWGTKEQQVGIVQDLNRISYMSVMSHLRVVSSPMDPSLKIRTPHELNTSQYGIMCPVESPDGASIGLVKNFALMCHVTFTTSSENVIKSMTNYFKVTFLENIIHGMSILPSSVKLMINNTWFGVIDEDDAFELVEFIRLLRRNALINIFTSISWNIVGKTINVLTEAGRCTRPLLIVDENQEIALLKEKQIIKDLFAKKIDNWYRLAQGKSLKDDEFNMYSDEFRDPVDVFNLKKGDSLVKLRKDIIKILKKNAAPIEFLDVEEVNTSMIAMSHHDLHKKPENGDLAEYTHCEIHPSLMLSAYTSTIALSNHNTSPRNIFSAAQGKQAIGIYASNFNNRIDTMSYILHYPQKRLISTRYSDLLKLSELPNGENLIVAISTHTGYNQEDSIIFNKASIERGMFNITAYKSYYTEERSNEKTGERIYFANPFTENDNGKSVPIKKYADYTKIDENGFPKVNEYIQEGDVIVGCVKSEEDKNDQIRDLNNIFQDSDKEKKFTYSNASEIADKTIAGKIDKVYVKQNYITGDRNMKIRFRKFKTPELGDKAASTHGQKGVCGLILPPTEMPFTKDGITPDIIVNPHAFPKRMTVGHLIECVLSKLAVIQGTLIDGTPFDDTDLEYFYDTLEENGFQKHGDEILYDGQSGSQIKTDIFIGPTHYYRLKHMVSDKINYRNKGKVQSMTMQPTQGRSNEGGLRIGEMESNALTSHGMAGFMKESFMERSDKHVFYVDQTNGEIIGINPKMDVYHGIKNFSTVEIPYALKLLTQELKTLCVLPRLHINGRLEIDHEALENHFDDFTNEIDIDDDDDDDDPIIDETKNKTLKDNLKYDE